MKQQNQLSMWEKEKKVIQSNITTPLPLNTISPFFFFITSHSHLSPFLSGNPKGNENTRGIIYKSKTWEENIIANEITNLMPKK